MMTAKNLIKIFSKATGDYFGKILKEPLSADEPYEKGDDPVIKQYTGLIGLTGNVKGYFYFTCDQAFLENVAGVILKNTELTQLVLTDLVGEIANQIAGAAQGLADTEFDISVPAVIRGLPDELTLCGAKPVHVGRLFYKKEPIFVIIGLTYSS